MSNVKTDYVDYALKPVGSGNPVSLRKFETYNATTGALESTVYVKDVTDYATVGSNILASDLNKIGNAVNSNSTSFASLYSPSATYAVGDYCTYQNVLYKCTTAISTPEAWNSAHWTASKLASDLNTLGNAVNSKATGEIITAGVTYDGSKFPYDLGTFSGQICVPIRIVQTGVIAILWYNSGEKAFDIGWSSGTISSGQGGTVVIVK